MKISLLSSSTLLVMDMLGFILTTSNVYSTIVIGHDKLLRGGTMGSTNIGLMRKQEISIPSSPYPTKPSTKWITTPHCVDRHICLFIWWWWNLTSGSIAPVPFVCKMEWFILLNLSQSKASISCIIKLLIILCSESEIPLSLSKLLYACNFT